MKTCFIVSPIGLPNSPIREHADLWLEKIVGPALKQYQINYVRVDDDQYIGGVADRIYQHLKNDDLVIADLTGRNANVYLEVGYRMAYNKPLILMTQDEDSLAFDLLHLRAVFYDLETPTSAKTSLDKTINSILLNEVKLPEGVTEMTGSRIFTGPVPPEEVDGLPDDCSLYIQY